MTTIRPTSIARYQAHPVGDRRRQEMASGEWGHSLLVRALLTGAVVAFFLFVLPFFGLVIGAALGIDVSVLP